MEPTGGGVDNEKRLRMYLNVLEHERHIEYRAFTTLGNYLTGNAFMVAAWAALYAKDSRGDFGGIDWVLALISVAGYFGGVGWALLGARNWEYARRLVAELVKCGLGLERSGDRSNLYLILSGVEGDVRARWKKDSMWISLSAHPTLLTWTPAAVALVYVTMLVILLSTRMPVEYGPVGWFGGLVAVAFLCAVLDWCKECRDAGEEEVKKALASESEPSGA